MKIILFITLFTASITYADRGDLQLTRNDKFIYGRIGYDTKSLRWINGGEGAKKYLPLKFYSTPDFKGDPIFKITSDGFYHNEKEIFKMSYHLATRPLDEYKFFAARFPDYYIALSQDKKDELAVDYKGDKYYIDTRHIKDLRIYESANGYKKRLKQGDDEEQAKKRLKVEQIKNNFPKF